MATRLGGCQDVVTNSSRAPLPRRDLVLSFTRMAIAERDPFEPDFSALERSDARVLDGGSRGLMLAVLEEAIQCLVGDARATARGARAREAARARQWILERDPTSLFSFESICAILGIEANPLRDALLLKLQHDGVRGVPSSHRVLRPRRVAPRSRSAATEAVLDEAARRAGELRSDAASAKRSTAKK